MRTAGSRRRCLCSERDVGFAALPAAGCAGSLGQPGMSTEQPAQLPGCLLAPRLPEHACLFPSCLHSLLDLYGFGFFFFSSLRVSNTIWT